MAFFPLRLALSDHPTERFLGHMWNEGSGSEPTVNGLNQEGPYWSQYCTRQSNLKCVWKRWVRLTSADLLKILLNLPQSINDDAVLSNRNKILKSLLPRIFSKIHRKPLKITFVCVSKLHKRGKFQGFVTDHQQYLRWILKRIPNTNNTLII